MNTEVLDKPLAALSRVMAQPGATHEVTLELDLTGRKGFTCFTVAAYFYLIGTYRPATETSPADYAVPIVTRVLISDGDWSAPADFHSLSPQMQELINEEIADQLGWGE